MEYLLSSFILFTIKSEKIPLNEQTIYISSNISIFSRDIYATVDNQGE